MFDSLVPVSDKTSYTQCSLKKDIEGGFRQYIAWIPSKFAKKGDVIKVKGEDGVWEDGWQITGVGAVRSGASVTDLRNVCRTFKRKLK